MQHEFLNAPIQRVRALIPQSEQPVAYAKVVPAGGLGAVEELSVVRRRAASRPRAARGE